MKLIHRWRAALAIMPVALLLALTAGAVQPGPALAQQIDAAELMRRVDDLWRGLSSRARLSMEVKTERYSRTMRLEAWSKGRERSLIRIISPKKDMGISTLKVEQNIWNYLPRINRVTKIPPSMMMGSWMGSHFTNDDLVKESSFEKDYTSSITFQGEREGKKIYEITSLPRPDAPVVWGKVVTLVEQETLLPLKTFYHDEEGALARVMAFDMRRRFGDRLLPARMELRPADKPGEYTTVIYEEMEFDVELSDEMFSLQNLRRG